MIAVQQVPKRKFPVMAWLQCSRARVRRTRSAVSSKNPRQRRRRRGWAWSGVYILTPRYSPSLSVPGPVPAAEIQLTDAIARLQRRETVLAYESKPSFDCGSKLGYLEANVERKKHPKSRGVQAMICGACRPERLSHSAGYNRLERSHIPFSTGCKWQTN